MMFADFSVAVLHIDVIEPQIFHEDGILFSEGQLENLLLLLLVVWIVGVSGDGLVYNLESSYNFSGDLFRDLLGGRAS